MSHHMIQKYTWLRITMTVFCKKNMHNSLVA